MTGSPHRDWREALRWELARFPGRRIVPRKREVEAAVLVPLVEDDAMLDLILERRADGLSNHAGQIAFPGGARDPGDGSPEATALREAWEEIGLDPAQVQVLGRLPDLRTPTGFVITPVVGAVVGPVHLVPSPSEVDRILRVPVWRLLDGRSFATVPRRSHGLLIWSTSMIHGDHVIWGATARMLLSFRRILRRVPGPWSQAPAG